jgi:UDP-N-acetylmuramoylalanine--D-glutamate ligase
VAAITDDQIDVFVVEASSFRLGHTQEFVPAVATWLNFGPDHQDVHASVAAYEAAKARVWADLGPNEVAVANLDDPVVMRNVRTDVPTLTFGLERGDYRVEGGWLTGPTGRLLAVGDLSRSLPHDLSNALAAAATTEQGGGDLDAMVEVLRTFSHLAHRVQPVAEIDGVAYVDDSKATTPHATMAAVAGFTSVVLIAGGRNKGLDLAVLAEAAPRLRAVVAIGDAADDVLHAFDGVVAAWAADSMAAAVRTAHRLAAPGDVVLLSPACASFDWYRSYAERGDDFVQEVRALGSERGA